MFLWVISSCSHEGNRKSNELLRSNSELKIKSEPEEEDKFPAVILVDISDSPDPFSPGAQDGRNDLNSITFSVSLTGQDGLGPKKEVLKRIFARGFLDIFSRDTSLRVKTFSDEKLISQDIFPEGEKQDFQVTVTFSFTFDGKDDQGILLPDGFYDYSAYGMFIREKAVLGKHIIQSNRYHIPYLSIPYFEKEDKQTKE